MATKRPLGKDLSTNFDIFFELAKCILKDKIKLTGNLEFNSNNPYIFDNVFVILPFTSVSLGADSENYLCREHVCDDSDNFPKILA